MNICDGNEKMKTSDFFYELPENLIAQTPAEPRDSARLMLLYRNGDIVHHVFSEIEEYLHPGDVLVLNETKVLPARLLGRKDTGAEVEVFLLNRRSLDSYECLVRPGRRLKIGAKVFFGDDIAGDVLRATVEGMGEDGTRIVRFECEGSLEAAIDRVGHIPLPPYITGGYDDIRRYNTVYAKHDGSSAAPTAGLHFTPELLERIRKKGVRIAKITLHVGLGTFRPVKAEYIADHLMHEERYCISPEDAEIINSAAGRIVCVGTTGCRAVESAAVPVPDEECGSAERKEGEICGGNGLGISETGASRRAYRVMPGEASTDIFIYPGYRFKMTDALITNFHLPKSTLIMLVSAFAGRENTLRAYETAVRENYRFFSFGDAMFIQ